MDRGSGSQKSPLDFSKKTDSLLIAYPREDWDVFANSIGLVDNTVYKGQPCEWVSFFRVAEICGLRCRKYPMIVLRAGTARDMAPPCMCTRTCKLGFSPRPRFARDFCEHTVWACWMIDLRDGCAQVQICVLTWEQMHVLLDGIPSSEALDGLPAVLAFPNACESSLALHNFIQEVCVREITWNSPTTSWVRQNQYEFDPDLPATCADPGKVCMRGAREYILVDQDLRKFRLDPLDPMEDLPRISNGCVCVFAIQGATFPHLNLSHC